MGAGEAVDVGVGLLLLALGGAIATRQAFRRTGALMALSGAAWLAGDVAGPLVDLQRGPLVHLLLSYPRGRPPGTLARTTVALAYLDGAVEPVGALDGLTAALAVLVVIAAVDGWARAGGLERRARMTSLAAAALVGGALVGAAVARRIGTADPGVQLAVYDVAVAAAALMLAADLAFGRWTRGAVTSVLLDVGRLERAAPLEQRLGRALGDPSVRILYRLGDGWRDDAGRRAELPAAPGRGVTLVEGGNAEPVAALVHDASTLADRRLAEAATTATRMALANARLSAEVVRSIGEVEASARRIVEAADDERERLARAMRAGAERRLERVAELVGDDEGLVAQARVTRDELRRLAAGIRPPLLADDGLDAALPALGAAAPLPVEVEPPGRRLPDVVEATAWFVCAEALANVAKHARASRATVIATVDSGRLRIEVADDGTGGARSITGTGLRGLEDRVEALGGRLVVVSPPGGGTRVVAELPLDAEVAA